MDIRILGTLTVVDGSGAALDLGPPQQRLLLAVLAVERDRVVPVDRLVDVLWDESPPATAVRTLHSHVARLRRALEPDRPPRSPPAVLVTEPGGYRLAVQPDAVDAARFERDVVAGRRAVEQGDAAGGRRLLESALVQWRGPPLADVSDHPFAQGPIAHLDELRLVATEELATAHLATGSPAAAVTALDPLVRAHPLRESLRNRLAVALYAAGRQADALRTLDEGRAFLRDELGLDPAPASERLRRRILQHDPGLLDVRAPSGAAPTGTRPDERPHDGRTVGLRTTPPSGPAAPSAQRAPADLFVGRSTELHLLLRLHAEAGTGRGRVVLVHGEAGAGKTRLVAELADRAATGGALVAWSTCHHDLGAPAYWPWVQLLRALLGELADAEREAALRARPQIRRLTDPATDGATAPDDGRYRLYHEVRDLVFESAARRPLLLVLDDLHWADDDALHLLAFLVDEVARVPLLLVVTVRDGEADHRRRLSAALADLVRAPATTRVSLDGLDVDEVGALLDTMGATVDRATVQAVHGRTRGNPFFVRELAPLVRTGGGLPLASTELPGMVPAGVREVVRARLASLAPSVLDLLRQMATLGREVTTPLLVRAVRRPAADVLADLDRAVAYRVLEPAPATPGALRFVHPLVRDAVLADLGALDRAALHARGVAVLTEAFDDDDHAERIAHHALESVAVVGVTAALDRVERAAEVALRRLAYDAATDLLTRGAELCRALEAGHDRDRRELAIQLQLAALRMVVLGDIPGVVDACERALELAARVPDAERQRDAARFGRAAAAVVGGDLELADDLAGRLLEEARSHGDAVAVTYAQYQLGVGAYQRGDQRRARRRFAAALATWDGRGEGVRAAGDLIGGLALPPEIALPAFAAVTEALGDDDVRSAALLAAARRGARQQGSVFGETFVDLFAAFTTMVRRDRPGTAEHVRRILEGDGPFFFPLYAAIARVLDGWAAADADPLTALDVLDRGQREFRATGAGMLQPLFLGLRADVLLAAGRVEEAAADAAAGVRRAEVTGERMWLPELLRLQGETARRRGDRRGGTALLRRAASLAEGQGASALGEHARRSLDSSPGTVARAR